jgi:hypothetical protein
MSQPDPIEAIMNRRAHPLLAWGNIGVLVLLICALAIATQVKFEVERDGVVVEESLTYRIFGRLLDRPIVPNPEDTP